MCPQLRAAYDYGAYKLSDFKINTRDCNAAFFYVNKVSESMTPRLLQSFYRSNFTLTRPWLTRLLSHLSLLPAAGLTVDEAQSRVSAWMVSSQLEIAKWVELDKVAVKEKREAGDATEAALAKATELAEKKVLIRKWQKARRRDARDKILAAIAASEAT